MSAPASALPGASTNTPTYRQDAAHQHWLEQAIAQLQGVAGTVHLAPLPAREAGGADPADATDITDSADTTDLRLSAAVQIPPPVLAVISRIAPGKGMAGLAQVRKAAVQTCDLQADTSGDVRPGARAVGAQAAIAVPVLDAQGEVVAVVGFAWLHPGDLPAAQQRQVEDKVREFRALLEQQQQQQQQQHQQVVSAGLPASPLS